MSLTVTVQLLDTPDAGEVFRAGAAHPVLGELIDLGTSAVLVVEPTTTVAAAVTDCCAALGPDVSLTRSAGPLPAGLRDDLATRSGKEAVFVVLPLSEAEALVVVAGPDLPSMGPLPSCDVERFRASLRTALGDPQEESLFTEPHFDTDQDEERRLNERLRQLYGD
ncbi:hypothetical protein [Polymorphospora sp. NPDC050346]|uniref:hypothetical protein n=1 Tax=Polymorphospora sp. NPDC050346 TaxID=3155780 RepID=UPI0033F9C160